MSSILSRGTEEKEPKQTSDSLARAFEIVLEETESGRATRFQDGRVVRPFLLVDLRAALNSVRKRRGGTVDAVENRVEETLQTGTSFGERDRGKGGRERDEGGRGALSKMFLVGALVGIGYMMRKRPEAVRKVVTRVTNRARSVAEQTEMRSGEIAQQTERTSDDVADQIEESGETVADEAADQVREVGETAADSVQEGGEMAGDQIEEAAETAENVEEKAEETSESSSSESGGSQSGDEDEQ